MPALFTPDDQPDQTNRPAPVEMRDLHLYRDQLQITSGNVIRMLEAIRAGDRTYRGVNLRQTIANARNIADAHLKLLATVEAECSYLLAERENVHPFTRTPPAHFGRRKSADLPATVRPAGA